MEEQIFVLSDGKKGHSEVVVATEENIAEHAKRLASEWGADTISIATANPWGMYRPKTKKPLIKYL